MIIPICVEYISYAEAITKGDQVQTGIRNNVPANMTNIQRRVVALNLKGGQVFCI